MILSKPSKNNFEMKEQKIQAMREGGQILGQLREELVKFVIPGVTFIEIENEAQRLIKKASTKPSFSTVPNYDWATCIMKNDALCHGIPDEQVVNDGDLMTIDIGLIHRGYHLDTTTSFGVGEISVQVKDFLAVGKKALAKAILQIKPGASVYQLSRAMQRQVEKSGYQAVTALTGHGVGEELHMEPAIPCVAQRRDKRVILQAGQTLAVEIMYTFGSASLILADDGWTYRTADGSLSGMFEDTVLVTTHGYEVLTNPSTSGII